MSRPHLLYVPIAVGVEAEPVIERVDWADVATFDVPGAGSNRGVPWTGVEGVCELAVATVDALGWERFGIVCDSHGQAAGIELALSRRERVEGIFIGHAAAHYTTKGERPAMNPSIYEAAAQLLEGEYRSFGRAITQLTQGATTDEQVDAWIAAFPQDLARRAFQELAEAEPELVTRLRGSGLPVVLGQHKGCLMWTDEGFEDAVAALPEAAAVVADGVPAHDPAFIEAMRAAMVRAGG
jgi:pimeloyl-ACP methyl ester carboxylesterase